jgi:hypothetical protein
MTVAATEEVFTLSPMPQSGWDDEEHHFIDAAGDTIFTILGARERAEQILSLLNRHAQQPMNRNQVAKIFAYIWHGDTGEWQGFLSKADAFLAYPSSVPSTDGSTPEAGYG